MRVTTHILASKMVHDFMVKIAVHVAVLTSVIGDQFCLALKLVNQNRPQCRGGNARRVHRANAPLPLQKRERDFLTPRSASMGLEALALVPVFFLAADERFV